MSDRGRPEMKKIRIQRVSRVSMLLALLLAAV